MDLIQLLLAVIMGKWENKYGVDIGGAISDGNAQGGGDVVVYVGVMRILRGDVNEEMVCFVSPTLLLSSHI